MATRPRVEQTRPSELVAWALAGRIRIPTFQRSYSWGREDVLNLFESIIQGYPVGTLIVSQRSADAATLHIGPLTVAAEARPDAFWVIDGQQRVTSLVGALAAPPETNDPRFEIFFDLRSNAFASPDPASPERRGPVPEHWFPMSAALSNTAMLEWQRNRPWLTDTELARCDTVVTAVRDFPIAMYVLEGDDFAFSRQAEVFQRINSSAIPLRHDEIGWAHRAVHTQAAMSDLGVLASTVRSAGFGVVPEELVLLSVFAAQGIRPDLDLLLKPRRKDEWRAALHSTERALGDVVRFLRHEAGIPHFQLLPYSDALPALTRFTILFGFPGGRAAELLRRWIWRGSVLGTSPNPIDVHTILRDDPVASADRLLRLLPPSETWAPDLSAVRLHQPQTKVNLLGMLSRRPRVLAQRGEADHLLGTVVDIQGVMEDDKGPLVTIVPGSEELHGTMANHLVHPHDVPSEDIRRRLTAGDLDPDVLESHLIDEQGLKLLAAGRRHEFIAHRAELVQAAIAEHVQENALFGFPDGPDPTSLITPGSDL